MKYVISLVALLFTMSTGSAVLAQGRGNGNGHAGGQGQKPETRPTAPAKAGPHAAAMTTKPPTTTVVTTRTPTSTPVKNPRLEARLQQLLPVGMNVNDAARGFKNWGQFVAAVHVSKNLNIPFADLKARMTGPAPVSLGQAIQASRPTTTTTTTTTATPTTTVVKVAEREADEDFRHARDDKH